MEYVQQPQQQLYKMGEIKYPTQRTFFRAYSIGILHEGFTDINQVTVTGQPSFDYNIDASTIYSALPSSGWMEQNAIYSYEQGMVQVIQSHERTIYSPNDTPALFAVYRANTNGLTWTVNEQVIIGDKRLYLDINYQCLQSHQTIEGQTPDITSALWLIIRDDWSEWIQPTGSQDAYPFGAKVIHNGHTWESTITSNVWEPGVYGWNQTDITTTTTSIPTTTITTTRGIVEWIQPQGTVGMYQIGDKVLHDGFTWQSTAANNVWEPGVYGWIKI
jgi:hypothetical protein